MSRRRRLRPAITAVLVLGTVVAGCSFIAPPPTDEARYFDLLLPAAGDVPAAALRVSDTTQTIGSVSLDIRNLPVGAPDAPLLMQVDGVPNALLVQWPGGTCDQQAALDLSHGGEGRPVFTLKLVSLQGGCMFNVVARRVIVTFDVPIEGTIFRLDVVQ